MVQFPWQFEYCRRHRRTAALVLATHNIETLKFASWAKSQGLNKDANRGWLRYIRRAETAAVAHADLIVAVSPEDRLGFIRLFGADPDRVIEIPNGADTRTYAPVDLATRAAVKQQLGLPQRPVVSYVAGPSPPNVAGFEWVRRIAMIADRFTFVVVGSVSARAERIGNLVITGRVDEAAQWLRAADISLCPIEYGGGTKIKLLEALAAGLPVVAFEESLHGTALIPGRHLLTAPKNEKGVALALEQLADSPALADNLGDAARAYILQHHDWERITDKLEAALVRLVESSKPSSPAQSLSHSSRTHG
jgi:glycosyltransferase involved in cell wall biosynthesis